MELRKSRRVMFERGYDARLMAIDGTWHRTCQIRDISETGAKLSVESSIEGLPLKEFFLVLSSTGTAFRRCHLAWDCIEPTYSSDRPTGRPLFEGALAAPGAGLAASSACNSTLARRRYF